MAPPSEALPGVHRLGSELVSWYVVEDGGRLTAVDAGLPGFASRLEADLAALGRRVEDVAAVVLTHSDADHTGLAAMLQAAGARVLVHERDEATLAKPRPKGGDAAPANLLPHLWRPMLLRMAVHFARNGAVRVRGVRGAETFADGDALDVPGSPRAIHTPGHTPGHCVLHFERHGALFAGDALCTLNALTGATGPQTMPKQFNVDDALAGESLARIGQLEADAVLVGHGEPFRGSPAEAARLAREARA